MAAHCAFMSSRLWHFVLSTIKRWRSIGCHFTILPLKSVPLPATVFLLPYSNDTLAAPFPVVRLSAFIQCNTVVSMSDVMGE